MNAETDLSTPGAASRGALAVLALIGAAAAGLVGGGLLASIAAGLLADALDLGQAKERLLFGFFSSLIGAPTGLALGLWSVLRVQRQVARVWRTVAGLVASTGLFALTLFGFFFALTTPPPPVLPYLHVELRIAPAGEPLQQDDTFLSVVSGRDGRGPTDIRLDGDSEGRSLVRGMFWLSRQHPVDYLVLNRRGLPEVRFTLNLPSDPPSTADFTHWLAADRPVPGAAEPHGETIEMRFRIDRRVER